MFCGVHFMAESADVLTGDHQKVILPDLNAGCSMADMADLDEVEEAWEVAGRDHRHRADRPDHLHELLGGPEGVRRPQRRRGVHVHQRPGHPRLGARQGRPGRQGVGRRHRQRRQGALLPRPAPRPQHRPADGLRPRRHAGVEPTPRARRPHRGRHQGRHAPALAGLVLGAPALHARARRGVPGRAPRRDRRHPPRVPLRHLPARRPRRLHRLHHPHGQRGARPAR